MSNKSEKIHTFYEFSAQPNYTSIPEVASILREEMRKRAENCRHSIRVTMHQIKGRDIQGVTVAYTPEEDFPVTRRSQMREAAGAFVEKASEVDISVLFRAAMAKLLEKTQFGLSNIQQETIDLDELAAGQSCIISLGED